MKSALPWIIGALLLLVAFALVTNPDLAAQPALLGGIAGVVILGLLLLRYESRIYAAVLISFLWAGTFVPFQSAGTVGRWVVLAAAAVFGVILAVRRGWMKFEVFHFSAALAVIMAGASVYDSVNSSLAGPKAASLAMLFLYCSVGLRISFRSGEQLFMHRFALVCEGLVWFTAVQSFVLGRAFFGNPNSLGAVMSVVLFPVILWSTLTPAARPEVQWRRTASLLLAGYYVFQSGSRASIASLLVASTLLLWALRRHRLLANGFIALFLIVATVELFSPGRVEDVVTGVVYKQSGERDLLQSRRSVWNQTVAIIEKRPFLGSGFGTSVENAGFTKSGIATFSRSEEMEHGSSYLSMVAWLGLLGCLPFIALMAMLVSRMTRAYLWMRRTGNAYHAIVPITAVLTAALLNAVFEDWLLAVGYYLSIVFWTFAFLLMDLVPSRFFMVEPQARAQPPAAFAANRR